MKKRWCCILIGIVMLLIGCAKEEVEVESTSLEEDVIEIGFCFDSFVIERWQRDRDAFVAMCSNDYGIEVNVQSANGDVDTQNEQIYYLINKGVDVIVICPVESEGIGDAVLKAKQAGIKVIAYDRMIYDADVDLYITFDNEQVGTLMAEALIEAVGMEARILMISGPVEDSNVLLINEGFLSVMEDTDCEIVGVEYATGWTAEYGAEYTEAYLENGITFDAVMCGNDGIASEVITTLSEQRLAGTIYVVGQDADLAACQRIVEGTQYMTVYKPIEEMAQLAAEYAVQLANGEMIEVEETMSDGTYDVPYIGIEPVAVTEENMNIIIDAGYHMEEDIYLNLE